MPEIQWKCTDCHTVYSSKADAAACEALHASRLSAASIKFVEWGSPRDEQDLFRGATEVGYGQSRKFIRHENLRFKYPKLIAVSFGANNKEGAEVAMYKLCKAEECALQESEYRAYLAEKEKKRR